MLISLLWHVAVDPESVQEPNKGYFEPRQTHELDNFQMPEIHSNSLNFIAAIMHTYLNGEIKAFRYL